MNDPQYWIAQGEDVQGPYARSKLRAWIAAGRVRPDMLFSLEGGEWVQGHDCPELFAPEIGGGASSGPPAMPAAQAAPASAAPSRGGGRRRRRPARARGPARRDRDQDDDDGGRGRHARPAGPPGAVMTVVILDFLGVALYGFLGVGAILLVAAAKKDGSTGMIGNMILVGGLF
ncbi:MAG: GYF domain-containing protein, partial [Planctomycetota bacterium]|nr:GYF domain-containing protein [Planctomycetota bacterium]